MRQLLYLKSVILILLTLLLAGCSTPPKSAAQTFKDEGSANVGVLVFGDSGYMSSTPGKSALMPVANAMKAFCKMQSCDFGVMTGDNIYPKGADGKTKGSRDPQRFKDVFIEPYGEMKNYGSDFRLYMALGNHDWLTSRAGAQAQVKFAENTRPFYMDGFFYSVKPPATKGAVELFIIDTEMMLSTRRNVSYDMLKSGEPVKRDEKLDRLGSKNSIPQTPKEQKQLDWLEAALSSSTATWKIVVAHHPLWESNSNKHKQTLILRQFLRPVICQYADAYFAGHQHTLELHRDRCTGTKRSNPRPLLHVISGAAGKSRPINKKYMAWQKQKYPEMTTLYAAGDVWGFMHLSIQDKQLDIKIISAPEGTESYRAFVQNYIQNVRLD